MKDECDAKILGAPEAQVVQTADVTMESPLLVCGFPSAGVVGTIAANTIIDQFKMTEIAHVRSKYMPPAAVFIDGRLRHPFRIYASESHNLLVVTTELPIAEDGIYHVSSILLDWAASLGVKETVVLDGIPVQGLPTSRKVLYAAEEEKIKDLEADSEMEILQKGIISGIAGSILSETLCRSMIGFALLTPAIVMIPDPEGAVKLLSALNRLYGVGVELHELQESGDKIREQMGEVAEHVEGIKRGEAARKGYERMFA
ncbi:MAG: proteasome assembly chaperone family protein [Candidatus Thorarchaeota archaeon]